MNRFRVDYYRERGVGWAWFGNVRYWRNNIITLAIAWLPAVRWNHHFVCKLYRAKIGPSWEV